MRIPELEGTFEVVRAEKFGADFDSHARIVLTLADGRTIRIESWPNFSEGGDGSWSASSVGMGVTVEGKQ